MLFLGDSRSRRFILAREDSRIKVPLFLPWPPGCPVKTTDRKPFYICTWLASKSIPEIATQDGKSGIIGAAGYLFFQTRDGYHFRSIDKIFQDKPKKKFIFTNTTNMPEGYDAKILKYDINRDIDLGKNLFLITPLNYQRGTMQRY